MIGGAGHRTGTLGIYAWDATRRRATNPVQTLKDLALTGGIETIAAAEAILLEGGELKRDGPYCSKEAECLTNLDVPGRFRALTIGHTIRFERSNPRPEVVAHEIQHVYDIENVSPLVFYPSYGAQWIFTGYSGIYWEQRAQHAENGYPRVRPRGWPWGPG